MKFSTGPNSQNAKHISFEGSESFLFFSMIFSTCPFRDIVREYSKGHYKNLLYFNLLDTGLVLEIPFRYFTLNLGRIFIYIFLCNFYCLEYLCSLTALAVYFSLGSRTHGILKIIPRRLNKGFGSKIRRNLTGRRLDRTTVETS